MAGVTVTRSVAYFHNADITHPTLVILTWAAIAAATVAIAWLRQSRGRPAGAQTSATSRAVTRGPDSRPSSQMVSAGG